MKKMSVFGSGGLGDAAIIASKINERGWIGKVVLTHVEPHRRSLLSIDKFYSTQGIDANVKLSDGRNENYWANNKNNFVYAFNSSWHGKNKFPQINLPMLPFGGIRPGRRLKMAGHVVIQVSAGRASNRILSQDRIVSIIEAHENDDVVIVGAYRGVINFNSLFVYNLSNKTTMQEYVDILYNCDVFYGHAGFGAYVAAMSGAAVKMVPEVCSSDYVHPDWNVEYILGDV